MPGDVSFTTLEPVEGERFKTIRRELGAESFGINVIVLQPRERGRIHDHDPQEEVYVVLEGELTLGVEGEEHRVRRWSAARVPSGVRRQLVNRSGERLVLLALGASGEHVGRDGGAWEDWSEGGPGRPPQEVPLPENLPE